MWNYELINKDGTITQGKPSSSFHDCVMHVMKADHQGRSLLYNGNPILITNGHISLDEVMMAMSHPPTHEEVKDTYSVTVVPPSETLFGHWFVNQEHIQVCAGNIMGEGGGVVGVITSDQEVPSDVYTVLDSGNHGAFSCAVLQKIN